MIAKHHQPGPRRNRWRSLSPRHRQCLCLDGPQVGRVRRRPVHIGLMFMCAAAIEKNAPSALWGKLLGV